MVFQRIITAQTQTVLHPPTMKEPIFLLLVSLILAPVSVFANFSRPSPAKKKHGEFCATEVCDDKANLFCELSKHVCSCQWGMMFHPTDTHPNGTCIQQLGGWCLFPGFTGAQISLPCGANAICNKKDKKCLCSKGFHNFDKSCRPHGRHGGNCTSDDQCGLDQVSGSRLVCENQHCSCNASESVYASVKRSAFDPGRRKVKTLCAPLATKPCFEGFCAPRAICSGEHNIDNTWHYFTNETKTNWDKTAECKCSEPYKLNPKTLQCLIPYDQSCNSTEDCVDGFVCKEQTGRCGCRPDQRFDESVQKCISNLGSDCDEYTECPSFSECRDKVCVCKRGYAKAGITTNAAAGGICIAGIGAKCFVNSDCSKGEQELICDLDQRVCACGLGMKVSRKTGLCECTQGRTFDLKRRHCVQAVGESCKNKAECGENSNCRTGICACDTGYVTSPSGRCVSDFDTSCLKDADCAQTENNLVCQGGKCSCESDRKMSPTTGRCSLEHGEPCNGTIPCFGNLECNGMCSCREGQNWQDDRCISRAGNRCGNDTDCVAFAGCRNGICSCGQGYDQTEDGKCAAAYGVRCLSDSDCSQGENQLTCNESQVCDCPSRLKMSESTRLCSLTFEATCDGSIPCGDGLVCRQNQCKCPLKHQDFDVTSGRCLHRVGGPCTEDFDCAAKSFCDSDYHSNSKNVGHCNCIEGTVETRDRRCINTTTSAITTPPPCSKDADCDTEAGLGCIDFQCRCSSNAVYIAEEQACLGYVGTECNPRFNSLIPTPSTGVRSSAAGGDCLPNSVCTKRTDSTPIYECLCEGPKFVELDSNNTCILSANYTEEVQFTTTTTTEISTTTTTSTTSAPQVCNITIMVPATIPGTFPDSVEDSTTTSEILFQESTENDVAITEEPTEVPLPTTPEQEWGIMYD